MQLRFFAGKGGVGKTTCAAASAVAAAEAGRSVLIVSTDPAHSLGDALSAKLGARPRKLPTRRGRLEAVELDAEAALERWLGAREDDFRTLALRGTFLDEEDVDRLFSTSLPGVDELVGLVELERLARARRDAEVIVDAAPTGHLLRLLETPEQLRRLADVLDGMQAKHRWIAARLSRTARRDPLDEVPETIDRQGEGLATLLRDPERTRVTWVTLPEPLAVQESSDGVAALDAMGMRVDAVWCNRLTPRPKGACAFCRERVAFERESLAPLQRLGRPLIGIPDRPEEPRGVGALAELAASLTPVRKASATGSPREARGPRVRAARVDAAVLDLLAPGRARMTVVLGKGGVGKTTCAAAIALAAARRAPRERILALSTDPAHSLGDALGVPLGDEERLVPGSPGRLSAREMDAPRALEIERGRHRASVSRLFESITEGARFDVAFDQRVLEDLIDLTPPGLDELLAIVAVIRALLRPAGKGRTWDRLVVDTAPTGHALRMLALPEAALEWVHAFLAILLKYREALGLGEVARDLLTLARDLEALAKLLRDPRQARLVVVTRPGELPCRESERLVEALRELALPVAAVVVNDVHDATPPACAECRRRAASEERQIGRMARLFSTPGCAILRAPAWSRPPQGPSALEAWAGGLQRVDP